jgi:hypothetical protein
LGLGCDKNDGNYGCIQPKKSTCPGKVLFTAVLKARGKPI